QLIFESVTSAREESREKFAGNYGFRNAQSVDEFACNENIGAVFILGPNNVHFQHLKLALRMQNVRLIYLEKPVCASRQEEDELKEIVSHLPEHVRIQVGFQYLQTSAVREALRFWESGRLGKPI